MVGARKACVRSIVDFIMENVVSHRAAFDVSQVDPDGTVFVRFRSCGGRTGLELAEEFNRVLWENQIEFMQTSDVQFQVDSRCASLSSHATKKR